MRKLQLCTRKKISNRGRPNLANASFLCIRPYLCNIRQRVLEFLFSRFEDRGFWRWIEHKLFPIVLHNCCWVRTRPAISKQRTHISHRPTPFLKSTNHLIWLTALLAFIRTATWLPIWLMIGSVFFNRDVTLSLSWERKGKLFQIHWNSIYTGK